MVVVVMAMMLATAQADLVKLVPPEATAAVLVSDPNALCTGLSAFCSQGHQRTLATLVARLKERSRREFAVDVLDVRELAKIGVAGRGGLAVLWMPQSQAPVLALPMVADETFTLGLQEVLGSRYARTSSHRVQVNQVTLNAVTVADVVTPRMYWATSGGQTFVSGPRGKEALAAVLQQAQKPKAQPSVDLIETLAALGEQQLVWLYGQKAASQTVWHVAGLKADGRGLTLYNSVKDAQVVSAWCSQNNNTPQASVAAEMADRLATKAQAYGYGASSAVLGSRPLQAAHVEALEGFIGAAAAARISRALAAAPKTQEALATLDAPFALALYANPSPHPGSGLRDLVDVAFVAHGVTTAQKARIKSLSEKLATSSCSSAPRKKTVVATTGQKGWSVHLETPAPGWEAAVVADTLIVTQNANSQRQVLQALSTWRPNGKITAPTAPGQPASVAPAAATVQLTAMAQSVEAMILAGGQGPLAQHPVAAALPQLLLLGPTGDLLREVYALGGLSIALRCTGQGLWAHSHITLAAP